MATDEHTVPARARTPRALTIAGSDSGAGAGIQADLKTFAALGVYGCSAITAITAQNTLGVQAYEEVSIPLIEAQIDAVMEDIGADAAKTGMLSSAPIIAAVAERARKWNLRLVVDPVMVAKGGDSLLQPEAVQSLKTLLLPLAEVVTPNLPEAEVLLGRRIETLDAMRDAARAVRDLGPRHVVIKGGHREEQPVDVYFDGESFVELWAERIQTPHTHGTGCTFSSAIAAYLARGASVADAVTGAKVYITQAIRFAPGIGHGHGPVAHFWQWEHHESTESAPAGEPGLTNRREKIMANSGQTLDLAPLLTRIRENKPLVHHITNMVVMNDTANITLGIGALPVMAHAREEVAEMVRLAGALVLNIGTLTPEQIEAMLIAGRAANERGVPIVLDPVGAGATRLRTESALRLLRELRVTVLRGNASEVGALVGVAGETRGVESISLAGRREDVAAAAAKAFGCATAITGARDVISDGERLAYVDNGHPLLATITGSGCMSTSLVGAFLAVERDGWLAATAALVAMGVAGEIAAPRSGGPGTFRSHLLDAVAGLDAVTLGEMQRASVA